jgi:hypothetical protein
LAEFEDVVRIHNFSLLIGHARDYGIQAMPFEAPLTETLEPLAYHRRLAEHFRTREKELWKWFASSERRVVEAEHFRLELLKSTYRLDADGHPALFQIVNELRTLLGITGEISVYQMQIGEGFNASLSFLPGKAHILFAGPVLTLLAAHELRALLAHELAHYLLMSGWDGEYLVAADIVRGLANDVAAGPEYVQTARLWNLYTELFCDRWAMAATGDLGAAVRTLVKAQTGLADVNAESYLRQAADIFRAGPVKAGQFTHPELYIRARALELWHNLGEAAGPDIERLIQGPLNLEQLDVLAQRSASDFTAAMLHEILRTAWLRTDATLAHAWQFFPDFETQPVPGTEVGSVLKAADKSVVDYACFVLLDFASVDRELGDAALAASLLQSRVWRIEDRFADLAQKEFGWTKKSWARLLKDADTLVSEAAAASNKGSPA